MRDGEERGFSRYLSAQRKVQRVAKEEVVKTSYLEGREGFPLVIEPNLEGVNLALWAGGNGDYLQEKLLKHGAILFRNFNVDSPRYFEQFVRNVSPDLLDYNERAAPRNEVLPNIYTSTEYPADESIPLHHEMSYSHNWPTKIWFFCFQPPKEGGRTPIADDRKVYELIGKEIKETFVRKMVMYVRNFGEGVDLPWQEVFQTNDKAVVEAYCRQSHMECEWRDAGRLRTRQVRQAIVRHPKTREAIWFNHAHMFHVSNLKPAVRESLLAEFDEDELPRNAFYGDGSPIEAAVLDEIRNYYNDAAVRFTWLKDDVLMLDNFLASHGREPYVGPRKILVAMAELFNNLDQINMQRSTR
jgi:alpha-ketoglutarate-dependent taurine dioxygenase